MPGPTQPPAPPKGDLDEVERAISVLGGRHPEHERTRRETLAAAEERRHVLEAELALGSRRRRRRVLVLCANALAVGVAAFVAWRLIGRARTIREGLTRDEAPFLAQGLDELASNQLTARRVLETDAPGASCFVALATSGRVRVQSPGFALDGGRSIGWCACDPGPVVLESADAVEGPTGLALLRIDARATGGPLARAWVSYHPDVWGSGGDACADGMLDAWIGDRRWPKPALDSRVLDGLPGVEKLHRAGFRLASMVTADTPFSVVEGEAESCTLALARDGGEMFLRAPGGARLIEHAPGAMLWCAVRPSSLTVWRAAQTSGPVVVLSAPAGRVGGLLGASECAHDAGYSMAPAATWLLADDHPWEAATILRASAVQDIGAGALAPAPATRDTRIAAVVVSPAARLAWDPPGASPTCVPALPASSSPAESVCAFPMSVSLWRSGDGAASFAHAPVPVWLSTLGARSEPDAVAQIPDLLALARQLRREGFEPTVLEGVTELSDGVRVVGRAGEDAVVAVGLAPKSPWVFPYTDAIPWDLGDAARVIALQPGTAVKLKASPLPDAPLDRRRTVVFRRDARP